MVSFIVFWEVMLRGCGIFHCVLGGYVREVVVFHCVLGGYVERFLGGYVERLWYLSLCFGRLC